MKVKHHDKDSIKELYKKRASKIYHLDFDAWYVTYYLPNAFNITNKQRKLQRTKEINFDVVPIEKSNYRIPLSRANRNYQDLELNDGVLSFVDSFNSSTSPYSIPNCVDFFLDLESGNLFFTKADIFEELIDASINDEGELVVNFTNMNNFDDLDLVVEE